MSLSEKPVNCACPGCTCSTEGDQAQERDGKRYCSAACADLHPGGEPCPASECHCEEGTPHDKRTVNDGQLDEAIEESFPASDPISP